MAREPKVKDLIASAGFSAVAYLDFMASEQARKMTLRRRQVQRLMKERGFTVFMVGETQRERKKGESG